MPSENVSWREEISINIEGGTADEHEIPVDVLMESLTGLQQLVNRTNSVIYSKGTSVSVKVKGGFIGNSFDYKAVLDFIAPFIPVAPELVSTIVKMFEYKMFTGWKRPTEIVPTGDGPTSIVKNTNGDTMVVQNSVILVADSSQTDSAMSKVLSALKIGAKKVEIGDVRGETPPAIVPAEEQDKIMAAEDTEPTSTDKTCIVEILTAQMDGRPTGWRFYDVEDETEFAAGVADGRFLADVNEGRYAVLRHKHAHALMRVEKQKINFRNRTIRTILTLTPMSDEEERLKFA
ncbi:MULTISPECIES: hypothetical protein [unclassified Desulfovibrio]|uniref:hypothetical protein n=1 Tax=unclassified Desulfovibrio TaxID=2593640 RepID=UPI0013EE245A|nr:MULTISPECIES: hypothetical protein [unclassified Desulfovibrio]